MLNYIWFALIVMAVAVAVFRGTAEGVTTGAVESARTAVEISIGLIGVMSLWLGLMKVAEKAGLIALLSRAVAPIMRFLFPEVPRDHPAMGSMVMNLSANMLGLNNAATPLGIRAMEDLQSINPDKETASNAMVMFMALNTSGVQLVPPTVVAVMAAAGSLQPTVIIGSTLIATICSTIAAIIATKVLQRFFRYPAPLTPSAESVVGGAE
jgi:spore maturation protein A